MANASSLGVFKGKLSHDITANGGQMPEKKLAMCYQHLLTTENSN